MTLVLLEATRPQITLQAEMKRVWARMDRLDAASARRVLAAVEDMRKDILDRLAALPTVTIDDRETFQATMLRAFAAELDEIAARFAQRVTRELSEDMRAVVRFSDEAHRGALTALSRALGVPPSLISLSPFGLADDQIEAAVLLNTQAIKGVSQRVAVTVNAELQRVVFGAGSRWDAIKAIREALATERKTAPSGKVLGRLTQQAMTIERTAIMMAFNLSADHAYRQVTEEIPDLTVTWLSARDKRVDPLCTSLDGKQKEPRGTFPGNIVAPPRHARCRCRTIASLPDWPPMKGLSA